jgi:hypothetical protein
LMSNALCPEATLGIDVVACEVIQLPIVRCKLFRFVCTFRDKQRERERERDIQHAGQQLIDVQRIVPNLLVSVVQIRKVLVNYSDTYRLID